MQTSPYVSEAMPRVVLYTKAAHSDEAAMRPAAVKPAKPSRDNIKPFAELPAPALVVAALSTTPEGADPSGTQASVHAIHLYKKIDPYQPWKRRTLTAADPSDRTMRSGSPD